MRVAIRTGSTFGQALVDDDGKLTGEHSGLSIVRRLLKLWPDPILVTSRDVSGRNADGFEVVPEHLLDVNRTVIINMDVVDSLDLYRRLRRDTWRLQPKIVNLVWWNTSEFRDPIERRELAMSTALFPTFCNSVRTEQEIRSLHRRYLTAAEADRATVENQNLGFPQPDLGEAQPDEAPPVVAYPAMWLFARKRPAMFAEIVTEVARRTPILVEMRLHPKAFPHPVAEELAAQPWCDVDQLAPREEYWNLLERTTAFLATAEDESYGLAYLEALWAGVIGVFPDRPWARNVLPSGYPFLYENRDQAETMLHLAVTKPDEARKMIDRAFNGQIHAWFRKFHSQDDFDIELKRFLENQVPDLRMVTE